METKEVAEKLVQYCREGKNADAINELYAENVVSLEPKGWPTERVEGKSAVIEKNNNWFASVEEIHSAEVSDPIWTNDHFTCKFNFDITFKEQGRNKMEEVAVYKVNEGKIVEEQFFYNLPPMS